MEGPKNTVTYVSGATGFGWTEYANTIKEVEWLLQGIATKHTAQVSVWDNELEDFIFYKRALAEPETDLIHNSRRDLRTKTRMAI